MSLLTVQTVTSCPTNTAELAQARKRKQCQHLSIIQNCTTPGNFQYHCVLNTYENETVEVCAPIIISQGKLRYKIHVSDREKYDLVPFSYTC